MKKTEFVSRNISQLLNDALGRSPVVLLTGARQTGKTTLVQELSKNGEYSYRTFDNLSFLAAAQNDPQGFIDELDLPVILDEVQRVPEIFLPIKMAVDSNRRPGMFLLTSSANPLLLPRLGDSLAGRMEVINLFPFSQGEFYGRKETFLDLVFSQQIKKLNPSAIRKDEIAQKLVIGGYPPVKGFDEKGRLAWFESYLTTILQRDVKDLANIEGLTQLPNLLALIASRAGSLFNGSELARSSGISLTTLNRYLVLLQALFMVLFLPPWSKNLGKRLVKSPKVYLIDSGILLHLLRAKEEKILFDEKLFGHLFENFVVTELFKQATWSQNSVKLFHYRTTTRIEVDLLAEDNAGKIVGIEIKSSKTVTANDFRGLKYLKESTGENFACGMVLYTGSDIVPFGGGLYAVPVSCLWG